jgi:hypothetical protein
MSTYKSRRPPRGNTQRRSNVTGFSPYTETLRPGSNEPVPPEASATPPPVLVNGSALPKAAPVVVHALGSADARDATDANDASDSPPDSSTRSKDGSPEPAPVKEDPESHVGETAARATDKEDESTAPIQTKAKGAAKGDEDEGRRAKPERAERRTKGKRGRTPTPSPVAVSGGEGAGSPFKAAAKASGDDAKGAPVQASAPVDLDDRFFAEGVHSESVSLGQ